MKTYLLTCYFVFYKYHEKINEKNIFKDHWFISLINLVLPFAIIILVVVGYLLDYFEVALSNFSNNLLEAVIMPFLIFFLFYKLLFKIYKVQKSKNVSQQTEIELNKYSIVYPICLYAISIIFFLITTYLRNGYIIKS